MKNILVAFDKNYGIGAEDEFLLWQHDLPADLRHFKALTTGHTIIMGRKTYDTIGRPLPNRQNIVISRTKSDIEGVQVVDSLEAAYDASVNKEVFVIGGGQIYELALATVQRIYATEIDATFDAANVFFPHLDKNEWKEVSREHHVKDDRNLYDFDFVLYERQ